MSITPAARPSFLTRSAGALDDLGLACLTVVLFVAVALATGIRSPWPHVIALALFLGALLFVRRRWPVPVLLLSVAAIFAFHLVSWSPAGWIWPAWAAYFTVAAMSRIRWLLIAGGVQLVYSAIHAWQIVDNNPARYVLHTLGEAVLLALIAVIGLAHARRMRAGVDASQGKPEPGSTK
ncbi:hypothetical protein AB0K16_25640 [Nonomuraea jabiensis]|uniref:hypothetical protein n=1 Tax=Nonomuraea jabiensis TaxID=882448 RepID=UPI003427B4C2